MNESGGLTRAKDFEMSRRGFLQAGGLVLGSLGLVRPHPQVPPRFSAKSDRALIVLLLVGGPSQLETWDPKPDAPAEVRGPFRSIETRCPGVRISEHLPRMASRLDRLAIVRSMHHDAAPIHETGLQLLQTGRLCHLGEEHPHVGSVIARLAGSSGGLPPFVILPRMIGRTGIDIPHGQSAGWLGPAFAPFTLGADPSALDFDPRPALDRARSFLGVASKADPTSAQARSRTSLQPARGSPQSAFSLGTESPRMRESYGWSTFGQCCLLARRLVEGGSRVVTVNMCETVFDRVTWDCHGSSPFSTLFDYAHTLLPDFDRAFTALIDDLEARGLLDTTLVLAAGEFGRTPRLNAAGGRDHWPGVWSIVLAGGGVRGGQVVGSSDAHASSPAGRPVTSPDLLATVYHSLGIDHSQYFTGSDGQPSALVDGGETIRELFA
jgi:hypothetical protein